MTTPYTTGSISLTNGSAVITGIGTAWEIALIRGGVVYAKAAGNALPIASVDSDTQITAAVEWAGATGTYSYALVRDTTYDAQIAQNAEALARLLAGLEAGTIWKYDMSGDTAGRAIYDGKPKGFSYLDVSVLPAQFWVKASSAAGDWAGPHAYGQGPAGPTGPRGMNWKGAWSNATAYLKDDAVSYNNASWIALVGNTNVTPVAGATWGLVAARGATGAGGNSFTYRGTYSAGTAYAVRDVVTYNGSSWIATAATTGNAPPNLPTTSNAYWSLMSAKGTDGLGTGDVVGPSAAADGRLAVFGDSTGKLIRALGNTLPQVTDLDAHNETGFFYFAGSATGAPPDQNGGTNYDAIGWMITYPGQRDQFVALGTGNLLWRDMDSSTWSAWTRIDGDMNGPGASTDGQIAAFNGTTGRLLKAIDIGTVAGTLAAGNDSRIERAVSREGDTGLKGYAATSKNLGTLSGTVTLTYATGNIQHATNGGAVTINAPTAAGVYTIIVEIVNGGSAGAITLSGFTKVDGDAFTTTNGSKFQLHVAKTNSAVSATVKALQ